MKSHLTVLLAAALCVAAPGLASADEEAVPAMVAATQDALRDLWIGHVFWVRDVVDARLEDNGKQAKAAEQQVVANAQAIAGAIEPFYGADASDRLFELLAGHWGAISDYLDATLADRSSRQDRAADRLAANARDIAAFLSSANPNWPEETLRGLLATHGAHHVQQIQQLHAEQYEEEAATWAAMKDHMYVIADALTAGLAKQFPDKFE